MRQEFFERCGTGRSHQLVDHHFRGGDDGSGCAHAIEADFPIPLSAGADGVGGDVHEVAFAQGSEGSLCDADVAFHAAEKKSVALSGETLEQAAEGVAAEAGEQSFVHGIGAGEERGDFGDSRAESLGVLGADERGNLEDAGGADEQLRVADELFFLEDRRQKFFLDVDDDQRALVGIERTARHLGVFGSGRGVVERGHGSLSKIFENCTMRGRDRKGMLTIFARGQ